MCFQVGCILDSETGRVFTITTDQGDSEILLIDSGTVYYRVSDQLLVAAISEKGIGEARVFAKNEAVRHAHWAFVRH